MLFIPITVNPSKHFCVSCKFQYVACYVIVQVIDIIILRIIKGLILILVEPHSKLISSLKPPHLLQHAVFCQSAIFLSSRLCHSQYHGLLI